MTNHDEETRAIYQKQHERISGNQEAFDRIAGMYKKNAMGMSEEWFKNKRAIDIGCGNVGAMILRLLQLGVDKCAAVDIGSEWIEPLSANIAKAGYGRERVELKAGSVTQVPYPEQSFDFVSVNGVLIHLEDMDQIEAGFMDAARVTAKNGVLYTSWGPCGGVMQGVIFPALRSHYRVNQEFKKFIDELRPDQIYSIIDKCTLDSKNLGGEILDESYLKSLFGEDFCVFLQNFIQAPTWWSNECTPEYVEGLYKKANFDNVRRISSFTRRTDIRKYFAPLHYDREFWFSKLMYGFGYVQYVGEMKR
jgi:ubiquinone/menaquinone biosynthesis C-methylase UbiE